MVEARCSSCNWLCKPFRFGFQLDDARAHLIAAGTDGRGEGRLTLPEFLQMFVDGVDAGADLLTDLLQILGGLHRSRPWL